MALSPELIERAKDLVRQHHVEKQAQPVVSGKSHRRKVVRKLKADPAGKRGRPRACPHDPAAQPELFRTRTKNHRGKTYSWADCLECKRQLARGVVLSKTKTYELALREIHDRMVTQGTLHPDLLERIKDVLKMNSIVPILALPLVQQALDYGRNFC